MPHPLDLNYELLKANLAVVERSSDEFKVIEKYLRATEPGYTKLQIIDVWKVDRHGVVRKTASVYFKYTARPSVFPRKLGNRGIRRVLKFQGTT